MKSQKLCKNALISIIAIPTITIVGSNIVLFMNLNKKVDSVKDELTNIKVEVANLNAKFGIVEERNTATNQRVDEYIVASNQRVGWLYTILY